MVSMYLPYMLFQKEMRKMFPRALGDFFEIAKQLSWL